MDGHSIARHIESTDALYRTSPDQEPENLPHIELGIDLPGERFDGQSRTAQRQSSGTAPLIETVRI
ncbi:MAG: hypothetical protein WA747_15020 [Steroidobacteraceae bacterium]